MCSLWLHLPALLQILIFIFECFIFSCQAIEKKAKAEKLLVELEEDEMPQQPDLDKEGITEEERFMLRKIGLRMKPFLLLGECFCTASLYLLPKYLWKLTHTFPC